MRVSSYLKSEIQGTNLYDLNLEEFSVGELFYSNSILIYGYRFLEKGGFFSKSRSDFTYKYLNVTMPTEYTQKAFIHDLNNSFDEVYGICKYSCSWLNSLESSEKYKYIYYPVSVPSELNPFSNKQYDVIYHGGIHSDKYIQMLDIMSRFSYRFATMSRGINSLTQQALREYATNVDLSPNAKYSLLNDCKISIAFNTFPLNYSQIENIQNKPDWDKNLAFSHLEQEIAPQFKSRVNEAAALGVINLIEYDNWNLVEDFYQPNKDFMYFTNMSDLKNKIQYILNNYDQFWDMRVNAYKKSLRYTRKNAYFDIATTSNWPAIITQI